MSTRIGILIAIPLLALALAACATTAPEAGSTSSTSGVPRTTQKVPAPDSRNDASISSASIVRTGNGWTSGGVEGPMPAPGSCHFGRSAGGYALPDPHCTPGAIDTAVTQNDLRDTVCRSGGYTSSVRPPLSVTGPAKRKLLAAYGIPASEASNYELDHLIELGVGGSSDVRNLWPQPNNDAGVFQRNQYVHNDKDEIESKSHDALCHGRVTLDQIQNATAADWTAAAGLLGLSLTPR